MKTYLDCVPCFLRQTLEVLRSTVTEEEIRWDVMRRVLLELTNYDLRRSPPEIGTFIHRLIRAKTGVMDPYYDAKVRSNKLALRLYPDLKSQVESSPDPWETALRLAIAGNIIDLGFKRDINLSDVRHSIDDALQQPLLDGAAAELKKRISAAQRILYIGDNAGEIVFDRLLIEQMPVDKITFVVRGFPIINDATMEDAVMVGLTDIVSVIDNGSDIAGTLLKECSPPFWEAYDASDLIITKGQGNYETLDDSTKEIWYLFRIKCPVVARDAGMEMGQIVALRKNPR